MNPAHSYPHECVAGTQSAEAQVWEASAPELARRAALGDFGDEVRAWLTESFRRHVIGGEPVEAALRLDRASRVRVRDDALRRAAALLALGDDGVWTVARRLAQAVARQERKQGTSETPLETAVAAALTSGVRVPESQEMLRQIITQEIPKKLGGATG